MLNKVITINCKTGLHARPAGEFTKTASKFKSNIFVEFNGKKHNAKSIINLLSAGIACGSKINIITDGDDEREAVIKLTELVESNFGE